MLASMLSAVILSLNVFFLYFLAMFIGVLFTSLIIAVILLFGLHKEKKEC